MLGLLNWFGNAAMAVAFMSVLGLVVTGAGPALPAAKLEPVDALVDVRSRPPRRVPGPSVSAYSPPRPRRTTSYSSSSSRRSFGGGGFRSGK